MERGSNINSPIVFRRPGKISIGEKGKGKEILGKIIKILKNAVGEEYQVVGNFIHS